MRVAAACVYALYDLFHAWFLSPHSFGRIGGRLIARHEDARSDQTVENTSHYKDVGKKLDDAATLARAAYPSRPLPLDLQSQFEQMEVDHLPWSKRRI